MFWNEFTIKIQCYLSSVHMTLALNFNLQVDSILIHLSHELHYITDYLASFKL
jgi:hypothetical protein